MKGILTILIVALVGYAFSQEEVGPLTGNPQLMATKTPVLSKVNPNTFDSTFIYTPDTISLPVFDDFSSSKFQKYNANFTDPGVTSVLVYHLLDSFDVPLPSNAVYTTQQTFKRTYIVSTTSLNDENFPPLGVKIGDLSSYPVTHSYVPVYPPYYIYDTVNNLGDVDPNPDTVWVSGPDVTQSSARQFFAPVNDLSKIWMDSEAFHNYTMALNPWSLGIATFDGLDEFGYPYEINSAITNYADHLTSKPIDMSGLDASDSVYFSFLYQAQGLCDAPETGDSLVLEFYAHDLLQWNRVWSTNGIPLSDFKVAHIKIANPDYFKKGFQFRFKNYGGLSGSLDHFHIDYVNLRTLSGYQDTLFKDFAIVYPVNTLIDEYTSVPWDHWKNNFAGKMSPSVQVVVRNGSNISENNQNGQTDVYYGGLLEGSFTLNAQTLSGGNINYDPRTTYYSYHDFSSGYHFDETKPGDFQEFEVITTASAQFPNMTSNDSTFTTQIFENYYSHDDGTAELAYGPTGIQSRLAVQYDAYEPDSLIGVAIHWVPSVDDVSDKLFLLTIWDDNNGQPGNVIYEDDPFFPRQPQYEYVKNKFTTYYLEDTMKLPVSGTYYIGWRQFDADRLNVGLDMNIVSNDKTFYSIDGGVNWPNSSFEGSVMIRPIFSTAMDIYLGIEDKELKEEIKVNVYPNPTNGQVKVETSGEYSGVQVMNMNGQVVLSTDAMTFDLSPFENGVYFIKFNGSSKVVKLMKY